MRCISCEVKRRLRVGFLAAALAALALFLGPVALSAESPDPWRFAALRDLPGELQKRLRASPDYFVKHMAELIIGHGQGGTIGPEGINNYIGLERARVRAYHMRRLLQADLDGDAAVSQSELSVLQRSVSARQRGILELAFRRGDSNVDGTVTLAELQDLAQRRALEDLTPEKARMYQAIMLFDLDRNGRVTLDELIVATREYHAQMDVPGTGPAALGQGRGSKL